MASQVARGFSPTTIDNGTGVLERFLALAVKPAWELSPSDVDAVMAALIERGVGAVTAPGLRRHVQAVLHLPAGSPRGRE